jgi:hypothetical protein
MRQQTPGKKSTTKMFYFARLRSNQLLLQSKSFGMSIIATDKDEKGPNAIHCLSCKGAVREGILHNGIKCIQNHHICVGECADNFVVSSHISSYFFFVTVGVSFFSVRRTLCLATPTIKFH